MNSFLRSITFPFMLLAAAGLCISLYVHLLTLMDMPMPWGGSVWFLHVGIFVVWIPAVLVSQRVVRRASQKDFWKIALSGCPPWMRTAGYVLFVYAILNFLYFMFFLEHGKTDEGSTIRGFSGHWLIFYGCAFAILYSVNARPDLLEPIKCPKGHEVEPLAQFCSSCGARITRPPD